MDQALEKNKLHGVQGNTSMDTSTNKYRISQYYFLNLKLYGFRKREKYIELSLESTLNDDDLRQILSQEV